MNKEKWIIVWIILIFITACACGLYVADKVLFDTATKDCTAERKAELKAEQDSYPFLGRIFWNLILVQLDNEEEERKRRIEAGLPIYGKDTALIWHDKYEISKVSTRKIFGIYIDGKEHLVLDNIKDFDAKKKTLYVLSDDGYAVVDKESNCRVYISRVNEESGYEYIEDEHIKYLSSYEDFSDDEREIFEKMKK